MADGAAAVLRSSMNWDHRKPRIAQFCDYFILYYFGKTIPCLFRSPRGKRKIKTLKKIVLIKFAKEL